MSKLEVCMSVLVESCCDGKVVLRLPASITLSFVQSEFLVMGLNRDVS